MFAWSTITALLPGVGFFKTTLGKVSIVLGLLVAAYIGFNIWLSNHEDKIRDAALLEFNQQQLILLEEQRLKFERGMKAIEDAQKARISELETRNKEFREEADELIARLQSGQFDGVDDESSDILIETLKELQRRANQGDAQ